MRKYALDIYQKAILDNEEAQAAIHATCELPDLLFYATWRAIRCHQSGTSNIIRYMTAGVQDRQDDLANKIMSVRETEEGKIFRSWDDQEDGKLDGSVLINKACDILELP